MPRRLHAPEAFRFGQISGYVIAKSLKLTAVSPHRKLLRTPCAYAFALRIPGRIDCGNAQSRSREFVEACRRDARHRTMNRIFVDDARLSPRSQQREPCIGYAQMIGVPQPERNDKRGSITRLKARE
ncbi:hypothetical protein [Paraburkholderia tropica]|uniref:hypothetical protein n=1 Tax=Paraburkholderia tropica TaxID=92647 RepID=UPI000943AA0F|nr:hypothetical protein [Paraburkholderia tropica]